ncbi:DUF4091 domain-containing protein [Paenibacillus sp. EC2-1]|uniref:DUF4091 domain-containing protein n=1 Tax=Paenibacillus sp. EC2-1 TaxID=3388665 RepID=UPI003BEF16B7
MSEQTSLFQTTCLHSLVKVFPDETLSEPSLQRGTALWSETFSFQVAYRSENSIHPLYISVSSELGSQVSIRSVGLSPSELPTYSYSDDYVLRKTPGLYPDKLLPIPKEGIRAYPGQWRSVWVTINLPSLAEWNQTNSKMDPSFEINISFENQAGDQLGSERFVLDVLSTELPKQKLIHSEWLHCDCIASYYKVDILGEKHWELIERYVEGAVQHGVNMLLTPLFTPPLDTAIGGERPTVQLVEVECTMEEEYRFNFDKLSRWLEMCNRVGIQYFEFSHLFTQWGAKHAPKIIATVHKNGEAKKEQIFGWDTDAKGDSYRHFLSQFLPALASYLEERGLTERCYFHVSDEPALDQLEDYRSARSILREYLEDFPFIEALSDYSFYEQGLVPVPIPSNDHIEEFLEHDVKPLWTYYCCGQSVEVSNRFFNMPSSRNRILGYQLYKFEIQGFLHWGYNFWNTQYSLEAIDPYQVTDAGGAFASGDAFVVYPGHEGPIDSIRWEVFNEALQDLRACELLESLIGRSQVLELLEKGLDSPLTFRNFPRDASWLLSKREEINRQIAVHLSDK